MKKALLFKLAVLVAAMMCALGASAAEAYANYTSSNTTLTFYYDNYRSSRSGTTYDLNTGSNDPGWKTDGTVTNVTKVVFAPSFADARPTSTYYWFYVMRNLQTIVGMKEYLNTSEVTDMSCMFTYCSGLTSLDLSRFDTSKVTDMSSMFSNCSGLTSLDLSSFDTSKVTDMFSMFGFCSGLTSVNLGSFNTSKVTDMKYMFIDCQNLRTIYAGIGWSTAAVTSSSMMFFNCTSLVGGQGTTYSFSNPTDKTYAHIDGGPSNPGYFTAAPQAYACYTPSNMTLTFYYDDQRSIRSGTKYDLNTDENSVGWHRDGTYENVTKVVFDPSFADARPTTTFDWFHDMTNLETITGMSYLSTSEVTNMVWMFRGCAKLTSLDLSSFNTFKVTKMSYMFYDCGNLQTIYASNSWITTAVTSSTSMFGNCTSLVGGQGTTYSSDYVDATYAHLDGGPSNPGYFSDKNSPVAYACYTSSNTTLTFYYDNQRYSRTGTTYNLNMKYVYDRPAWYNDGTCHNVTKVVFDPSFADARPTTTYYWFCLMENLQSVTGMEYLKTSEVTNMSDMFNNCTGLTSLDLSGFNTANVTDMFRMFYNCYNLRTIYVGRGWNTTAVTSSINMFNNCTSLVGGQGTTYDANHVNKDYAHIDGGTSNPGYFTDKNASLRGDVNGDGSVNISDVTALIDLLLGGGTISNPAADCNQDSSVNISDVTALIDYLLSSRW